MYFVTSIVVIFVPYYILSLKKQSNSTKSDGKATLYIYLLCMMLLR